MGNAWKWWIVVVASEDWYVHLNRCAVVKARSPKEAERRAAMDEWQFSGGTFGPFAEKPEDRSVRMV